MKRLLPVFCTLLVCLPLLSMNDKKRKLDSKELAHPGNWDFSTYGHLQVLSNVFSKNKKFTQSVLKRYKKELTDKKSTLGPDALKICFARGLNDLYLALIKLGVKSDQCDEENEINNVEEQPSLGDMLGGGLQVDAKVAKEKHNLVYCAAANPGLLPSLVVLDEPTVALDPYIRHQLWDSIKELKKSGVTVLLTTHYLDEAEQLSDRVCVLDRGSVLLIDTPSNLKTQYKKARLEDVFLQLMQDKGE